MSDNPISCAETSKKDFIFANQDELMRKGKF